MTRGFLHKTISELGEYMDITLPKKKGSLTLLNLPNNEISVELYHPVITSNKPGRLQIFKWGFILFHMPGKDKANYAINAPIESIFDKPAFKDSATHRRCIIPFDGYYETKYEEGVKRVYKIERRDKAIFFIAGIWDQFRLPGGEMINGFLPITHVANEFIKNTSPRMPFILYPEYIDLWLDRDLETDSLFEMIPPIYTDEFDISLVKS